MTGHILGHLARRFAVSEENLATEALTWLLRDPAANEAVCALARATGTAVPATLNFVGQVGNPESGRPDIVGTDDTNSERLIIEAKFAVALTDKQPNGYLERLPTGEPGVLLVVAPSARLRTLWAKLHRALPEHSKRAPSPSAALPGDLLHLGVDEHRVLALTSWRHLVGLVLLALRTAGSTALAQDAEQLLALTEVMDSRAYSPVLPGDYGPCEARRIQQLQRLIDGVRAGAGASLLVEPAGRSSHGRIFYGWYLRSRKTQKALWFGFLPRLWDREGISPLWMQVRVSESWGRHRLAGALAPLHAVGQRGLFEGVETFNIALGLAPLLTEQQTIVDLLDQVEAVVALLDAATLPGEAATPDVLPNPDDDHDELLATESTTEH